jgi:hypothetical protein
MASMARLGQLPDQHFLSTCKQLPRVGLANREDSGHLVGPHAKERGPHIGTETTEVCLWAQRLSTTSRHHWRKTEMMLLKN